MDPAVRRSGSGAGVTFIACGCRQIIFRVGGTAMAPSPLIRQVLKQVETDPSVLILA